MNQINMQVKYSIVLSRVRITISWCTLPFVVSVTNTTMQHHHHHMVASETTRESVLKQQLLSTFSLLFHAVVNYYGVCSHHHHWHNTPATEAMVWKMGSLLSQLQTVYLQLSKVRAIINMHQWLLAPSIQMLLVRPLRTTTVRIEIGGLVLL